MSTPFIAKLKTTVNAYTKLMPKPNFILIIDTLQICVKVTLKERWRKNAFAITENLISGRFQNATLYNSILFYYNLVSLYGHCLHKMPQAVFLFVGPVLRTFISLFYGAEYQCYVILLPDNFFRTVEQRLYFY